MDSKSELTQVSFFDDIRHFWANSKAFRIALSVALVYCLLRLLVHFVFLISMPSKEASLSLAVPQDLQLYLDAAEAVAKKQDLYPKVIDRYEFYQYTPAFALAFTIFNGLSPTLLIVIHTFLHIIAYGLLFIRWNQILHRLQLKQAEKQLSFTLPLWLVFAAFWADLGFLNIYIITALLTTLLIEAILTERLRSSLLWGALIVLIKPHWGFAIAAPLILGRRRFFLKLLVGIIITYGLVTFGSILIMGPTYGWKQFIAYLQLMITLLDQSHPWRTVADGFLGYNHSITQIVVYLLGINKRAFQLSTILRLSILAPLALIALRGIRKSNTSPIHKTPIQSLDTIFMLYLGIFIWLDAVWELSLGIVIFAYLLGTLKNRHAITMTRIIFLPYALLDCWQLISVLIFGPSIVTPGFYVLTDPSIYLPLIMIVILTFYTLLLKRLWNATEFLGPLSMRKET